MKRYLFSILFALFAIGGVVTCYIYGAINHLPAYKLSNIHGDSEEGAAAALSANYYGTVYSEFLNITDKGSLYRKDQESFRQNILNTRSWFLEMPDMKQLVNEQRKFMRGKSNINGFYNDEKWLIYVEGTYDNQDARDTSEARVLLNISVLDKSAKQTLEHELTISDINNFFVQDVQLIDDRIHILISFLQSNNISSHIFDYVVDPKSGKLISNDRLVMNDTNLEDYVFRNSSITNSIYSAPSEFVIVAENKQKIISREGKHSYSSQTVAEYYYSYSYRTGELVPLPIEGHDYDIQSLYDNVFVFAENNHEQIVLSRYHLSTGEADIEYAAITAAQIGATEIKNSVRMNENRLYILLHRDGIPMTAVVDLSNGALLYTGEVVFDGPASESKARMERLHSSNIEIIN